MVQKDNSFLFKYFPAMASGLALTLSFPKTGLFYLAFFALVPFLISIRSMTARNAFLSGFTLGFFHFITLVYWVVPTLTVYGGLHPVLAVSTLTLFCCYLSLYPGIFAFLLKKTDDTFILAPVAAAALWAGLEYIRTYAFTGFSWGALGYSQYTHLPLIQIADLSGVYGVSFLIVLVNYTLADSWYSFKNKCVKKNIIRVVYTLILVAGTILYGYQKIKDVTARMETAPRSVVTVVQGNIRQDLKWSREFKEKTVGKYIRLSRDAAKKKPDLIIWPETALPFYYGFDKPLSEQVDQCIRSLQTHFLIGSPAFTPLENETRFYNRTYMLDPFSIVTGTYDKTHLVPFGEYVPLGKYLTFLGKLTAQAGNFSSGDKGFAPLPFNGHKTGILICFEILFPGITSEFVKNGADMLTTVTNDAWFGHTSAAQQHFAIAVFRSVESKRTLARAANTGISGFIDPTGTIVEATDLFTDETVTKRVPFLTRLTFYTRYGDVFAWGCLVAMGITFMLKRFLRNKR